MGAQIWELWLSFCRVGEFSLREARLQFTFLPPLPEELSCQRRWIKGIEGGHPLCLAEAFPLGCDLGCSLDST